MINSESKNVASALLRDEDCDWPETLPGQDFIDFAQAQGILLLLSNHLQQIEAYWPKSVHQAVVIAQAAGMSLLEQRAKVVRNLFERFNQQQIKAALFKGAANAYLLYPKPIFRQHADIDILINDKDYSVVIDILAQIGFEIDDIKPTKFGPYQTTATLKQIGKPDVLVDLHWKINNRLLLADKLNMDEIWGDALPINHYGEKVVGLNYQNALLAACIHEAGSLPVERGKLIGLYDAYLLVKYLGKQNLLNVLVRAKEKGITKICLEYIKEAIAIFGTQKEMQMITELESDFGEIPIEQSAKLLKSHRGWLEDQKLDWLAVEGAISKIEYIISKFSRKLLS